jgi:hypothetical protein
MRARGCGSIVNGSSKAGLSGAVSGITYTASEYLAYLLAIVTTDLLLAVQANWLVGTAKNVAWQVIWIRCVWIWMLSQVRPIHYLHLGLQGLPPIHSEEIAQTLLFLIFDYGVRICNAL